MRRSPPALTVLIPFTREQEVKMRIGPEKTRMKDAALAMRKQRAPLAMLGQYLDGPIF